MLNLLKFSWNNYVFVFFAPKWFHNSKILSAKFNTNALFQVVMILVACGSANAFWSIFEALFWSCCYSLL